MSRRTATSRDVKAGCYVCHGGEAHWFGGQAQGTAAKHHDQTGHPTWAEVYMHVSYGNRADIPKVPDHTLDASLAALLDPATRKEAARALVAADPVVQAAKAAVKAVRSGGVPSLSTLLRRR